MKLRLIGLFAISILAWSGCATTQPPPPNTCAVWSRSAEAKLTSSGVWARVLSIRFTGRDLGHEVCIFLHSDGNLWCYNPSLDNGQGSYGGSYCLWTTNRDPLYLARCVTRNVQSAKFL